MHPCGDARAILILGHGAGGGLGAPDLLATTAAAGSAGIAVALVEQPYRVAGRRSPAPARQLDAAWAAVVAHVRGALPEGLPLLVGGRSSGARVACRTAGAVDAAAVLCLAFPLQPPRRTGKPAAASRLGELDEVGVPTLVVQGSSDPFGMPPDGPSRTVVEVAGNHSLRSDVPGVKSAVGAWLSALLDSAPARPSSRR